MKKYSYAVHTGIAGGRNFAAAALCREERVTDIQNRLRMLDQMLSPCEIRDPVLLDHLLSDGLRKVCPEDVSAAAITMSAWDRGPIGGSVIGAPHSDGASAEGELEALEEGLWFMAYPGGPGADMFATACPRCTAVNLRPTLQTVSTLACAEVVASTA